MAVSTLQKRRKCYVKGSRGTPLRHFGQKQGYFEALRCPVRRFSGMRLPRPGKFEKSFFKNGLKTLKGICEYGHNLFFAHDG